MNRTTIAVQPAASISVQIEDYGIARIGIGDDLLLEVPLGFLSRLVKAIGREAIGEEQYNRLASAVVHPSVRPFIEPDSPDRTVSGA